MADTWFRGRIVQSDRYGLKKIREYSPGLISCILTDSTGTEHLWFNLIGPPHAGADKDEYFGWVNINLHTGAIEFGEPAA